MTTKSVNHYSTSIINEINRLRYLGPPVLRTLLDSLVLLNLPPTTSCSGILIVRLDAIGDFFLWMDSAKRLREMYKGERITLLANSSWADLAKELPYFDEVVSINLELIVSDLFYRWKIIRWLKKQGFRKALNPTYSRDFLKCDSLIRATGAQERIGFQGEGSNIAASHQRISDRWYTKLISASAKPLMELDRNAEFINGLGEADCIAQVATLPKVAKLSGRLLIEEQYFILFPGASWNGRQWPVKNFANILRALHEQTGWMGVLCGSAADIELCAAIISESGTVAMNLAGKTTLPQLVEVVRNALLLVGNETSAVHIAAAVKTPSVCILGGGHYGRFMPYSAGAASLKPVPVANIMECFGCNWHCIKQYEEGSAVPCISSISVDQVLAASIEIATQVSKSF